MTVGCALSMPAVREFRAVFIVYRVREGSTWKKVKNILLKSLHP